MPVNLSDILDGTIPVTAAGIEVELDPTNVDGGFKNTSAGVVYYAFDKELYDIDPSVAVQQGRGELAQNKIVWIPDTAKKFVAKTASGTSTLQAVDSAGSAEDLGSGTMADQNAGAVDITGGTIDAVDITGGTVGSLDTPLAVADGGTGGTTAEEARDGLELGATDNVEFNDITAATVNCPGGTISAYGGDTRAELHKTYSNAEGNAACLVRSVAQEEKTLDLAATSSTSLNIPANVLILGVQLCVNGTVSDDGGDDTWSAELNDGAQVAVIVSGAAAAVNTKVNKMFAPILTDAVTNIKFTPNGGSFAGGVIECLVYYEELASMGNYVAP